MTALVPTISNTLVSALVASSGARARIRFLEFFAANIRNRHTGRAYAQATRKFLAWCESAGVTSIADVKPLHVAPISSSSAASDPRQVTKNPHVTKREFP